MAGSVAKRPRRLGQYAFSQQRGDPMQSLDIEVVEALSAWLVANAEGFLCTIVETFGSSPRPAGSMLAVGKDGPIVGSLSGGCVEDALVEDLQNDRIDFKRSCLLDFGIEPSDVERLGLPCGGTLRIVVERFSPARAEREHIASVLDALHARRSVTRHIALDSGAPPTVSDARHGLGVEFGRNDAGQRYVRHTLGPRLHLVLLGAGAVSQFVARIAHALDYEVTVCDPRPSFRQQWPVETARCLGGMPDDAIRALGPDSNTAIIALSHDPRIDDMGLLEALETDAFFVGAMGSRASSENRLARLEDLGVSQACRERLQAPVGMHIGSKTPAEIAVSILAELTASVRLTGTSEVPHRRREAAFRASGE